MPCTGFKSCHLHSPRFRSLHMFAARSSPRSRNSIPPNSRMDRGQANSRKSLAYLRQSAAEVNTSSVKAGRVPNRASCATVDSASHIAAAAMTTSGSYFWRVCCVRTGYYFCWLSLVAVCRNAGLRKIKLMGSACVSRTPAQCCHGAEYLTFGQLHLQVELTIKDSARLGHRSSA